MLETQGFSQCLHWQSAPIPFGQELQMAKRPEVNRNRFSQI